MRSMCDVGANARKSATAAGATMPIMKRRARVFHTMTAPAATIPRKPPREYEKITAMHVSAAVAHQPQRRSCVLAPIAKYTTNGSAMFSAIAFSLLPEIIPPIGVRICAPGLRIAKMPIFTPWNASPPAIARTTQRSLCLSVQMPVVTRQMRKIFAMWSTPSRRRHGRVESGVRAHDPPQQEAEHQQRHPVDAKKSKRIRTARPAKSAMAV